MLDHPIMKPRLRFNEIGPDSSAISETSLPASEAAAARTFVADQAMPAAADAMARTALGAT